MLASAGAVAATLLLISGRYGAVAFNGWLERPLLVWLGRRSYGVYLWHPLMLGLVGGSLGPVRVVGVVVLTIGVVTVCYRWVEAPVQERVRRALGGSREVPVVSSRRSLGLVSVVLARR